jgi:hypothetical protein
MPEGSVVADGAVVSEDRIDFTEMQIDSREILRGFIRDGIAFYFETCDIRNDKLSSRGKGSLVSFRRSLHGVERTSAHEIAVSIYWSRQCPEILRCQMTKDTVYVIGSWQNVTFGHLNWFPVADIVSWPPPPNLRPRLTQKELDFWNLLKQNVRESRSFDPYRAAIESIVDSRIPQMDVLVEQNGRWTLFVLSRNQMDQWEYQPVLKNGMRAAWDWKCIESWRADWLAPFFVHMSGSTYYFVSESGKIQTAKRRVDGGNERTNPFVTGISKPAAMITDVDAGRTFLIGRNSYIELCDRAEPTEISVEIPTCLNVSEAVSAIAECGRVLKRKERPRCEACLGKSPQLRRHVKQMRDKLQQRLVDEAKKSRS